MGGVGISYPGYQPSVDQAIIGLEFHINQQILPARFHHEQSSHY
jgi:hypothetical protein